MSARLRMINSLGESCDKWTLRSAIWASSSRVIARLRNSDCARGAQIVFQTLQKKIPSEDKLWSGTSVVNLHCTTQTNSSSRSHISRVTLHLALGYARLINQRSHEYTMVGQPPKQTLLGRSGSTARLADQYLSPSGRVGYPGTGLTSRIAWAQLQDLRNPPSELQIVTIWTFKRDICKDLCLHRDQNWSNWSNYRLRMLGDSSCPPARHSHDVFPSS